MSDGDVWVWDYGVTSTNSDPRWDLEKFHSLFTAMLGASNQLIVDNKHIKNVGDLIIASVRVASILELLEKFNYSEDESFGTIGRFTILIEYEAIKDGAYVTSSNPEYPQKRYIDVRGLKNCSYCHPYLESDFEEYT